MFRQVRGRVLSRLREAAPFRRFCTAIYLKLSHHHDMLGLSKCLAGYEDLLDGYAAVKNSRASAELAERLLERWCKNNPPQKAKQPPPDGTASDVDKEPHGNADGDGESSDSGDAGGIWKSSTSFARTEIQDAIYCLQKAFEAITEKGSERGDDAPIEVEAVE
jgi:hypothetical protein